MIGIAWSLILITNWTAFYNAVSCFQWLGLTFMFLVPGRTNKLLLSKSLAIVTCVAYPYAPLSASTIPTHTEWQKRLQHKFALPEQFSQHDVCKPIGRFIHGNNKNHKQLWWLIETMHPNETIRRNRKLSTEKEHCCTRSDLILKWTLMDSIWWLSILAGTYRGKKKKRDCTLVEKRKMDV